MQEADKIEIPNLTDVAQFRSWKTAVREAVASASKAPQLAFQWVRKVETPNMTVEKFIDSEGFPTLDSKLASALSRVTKGMLGRNITLEQEKQASHGRMMNGRQILLMVYQHFRITETEGHIMDFQDLLSVKMYSDDLNGFFMEWESVLVNMKKVLDEEYLETMFRAQVETHPGLKEDMAYYDRLPREHSERSYSFLLSAVRRFLEKQRAQKAKAERSKSGVRPSIAATDDRPICFAYQRGKCTQGRNCKYKHEKNAQSPAVHPREFSVEEGFKREEGQGQVIFERKTFYLSLLPPRELHKR